MLALQQWLLASVSENVLSLSPFIKKRRTEMWKRKQVPAWALAGLANDFTRRAANVAFFFRENVDAS